MPELSWYYPDNPKALRDLLAQPGIVPHGGGTALLKRDLSRISGMIDLSQLPYRDIHVDSQVIRLGAMATYCDVLQSLKPEVPDHILVQALQGAASTPLRNRITVGGSIAGFPVWSDLMGPLLALDAEVTVMGAVDDTVTIRDYVGDPTLRKHTMITTVSIPNRPHTGSYHRETRTRVDYPAFTVTIVIETRGDTISAANIVLVGTSDKYVCLDDLAATLLDTPTRDLNGITVGLPDNVSFPNRKHGSAAYLKEMACVALRRGLNQLTGGEK